MPDVDIELVVETLAYLGGMDVCIRRLKRDLESALLEPRLSSRSDKSTSVQVDGSTIRTFRENSNPDTIATLDDIWTVLEFLSAHLPRSICEPLSTKLLPSLFETLTYTWLDGTVPVQIEQMPIFQQILDRVSKLAEQIDNLNWSSTAVLKDWVQNAPRTWLSKRRETALGAARSLLFSGLRQKKTVERVETQTVSKGDVMMGGEGADEADEAWAADWEEEDTSKATEDNIAPQHTSKPATTTTNDDDDASAWDMDDDNEAETANSSAPVVFDKNGDGEDEDAADAWGWGEEEAATEEEPKPDNPKKALSAKESTPAEQPSQSGERELTLRETYTVTAVPDGILEIVMQVVSDAETLTDPRYGNLNILGTCSTLTMRLATLDRPLGQRHLRSTLCRRSY